MSDSTSVTLHKLAQQPNKSECVLAATHRLDPIARLKIRVVTNHALIRSHDQVHEFLRRDDIALPLLAPMTFRPFFYQHY